MFQIIMVNHYLHAYLITVVVALVVNKQFIYLSLGLNIITYVYCKYFSVLRNNKIIIDMLLALTLLLSIVCS